MTSMSQLYASDKFKYGCSKSPYYLFEEFVKDVVNSRLRDLDFLEFVILNRGFSTSLKYKDFLLIDVYPDGSILLEAFNGKESESSDLPGFDTSRSRFRFKSFRDYQLDNSSNVPYRKVFDLLLSMLTSIEGRFKELNNIPQNQVVPPYYSLSIKPNISLRKKVHGGIEVVRKLKPEMDIYTSKY